MSKDEKLLVGKKIISISMNGYGMEMIMDDGTKLWYCASDGGYSTWEVVEVENNDI